MMPLVVPWTKSQGEVCVFTANVKVVLVAFEGVTATDCGALIPVFDCTLNESWTGETVMVCAIETAENATASTARENSDLIRTTFNINVDVESFPTTLLTLTKIATSEKTFLETILSLTTLQR